MHELKLVALFLVGFLPGRLGVEAETRDLRREERRLSRSVINLGWP